MKRSPLYVFCKSVAQVFFRVFMPFRIYNIENMPKTGRVIICCNHITNKDAILLTAVSGKRQIHFMAKAELFKNPLLGKIFRNVGAFSVNRGKGDSAAINRAQELLQEEQVLGLFLEGKRSKDGSFLQPKSGAVMLAFQNKAPILPVCITGRKGVIPRLFHRVDVVCGPLITPDQLQIERGSGTEYRQASRLVMNKIIELRDPTLVPKALKEGSSE
ncbi:MAG: lysophospholipid acyltransferase family protein [Clostridium sp.]|uniref:lysophospholipid acyltransferase family protein n=1 Tax=Clostridium sp. TaxID=1506 RepID=UPI00290D603F|nr:lysophospholipid acyltransferase family protein [Clostridium sp.]MDU7337459.1 lysophospholipid acyltransferase family protein [Clostridium sp.]